MTLKNVALIYIAFSLTLFYACQSDSAKQSNPELPEQQVQNQNQETHSHDENSDGHSHEGHDHAGHDHSHDTPASISAPSENKTYERKSPPKYSKTESTPQLSSSASNQVDALDEAKGTVSAEEWSKKKAAIERTQAEPDPNLIGRRPAPTKLPSACNLISAEKIARILKVNKDVITLKDGSGSQSKHSQSCFFRWTHNGVPNSGILIQVQDNPLPEEAPDWASYYISAKINQGEQIPDGSGSFRYERVKDGLGDAAAFSGELSRYVWRVGTEYVFMIAFNFPGTPEQKKKWAEALGTEVMNNF
ncbi:MAG: hypothetical protein KJO29_00240 [Bacteroidia bacterium]|nr:hypothetical protein [Bacteroidia bacterium]